MVPKIPEFRKRGRSGEHAIASLLSTISNVMVPDYDFGLDFHCELLVNNSPSGKFFWVQAKSTESFDEVWSQYVNKETIAFWLQQVSPVFIMVFEQSSEKCYWLSVEKHRTEWGKKLTYPNGSVEVVVGRENVFQRNGENVELTRTGNK